MTRKLALFLGVLLFSATALAVVSNVELVSRPALFKSTVDITGNTTVAGTLSVTGASTTAGANILFVDAGTVYAATLVQTPSVAALYVDAGTVFAATIVQSPAAALLYADAGTVWAQTALKVGATGTPILTSYAGSGSIDFAGVTDACEDSPGQTLTGAAVNDVCAVGLPTTGFHANSWTTCYVSAADTVKVRYCAHGASGNPSAMTIKFRTFAQ